MNGVRNKKLMALFTGAFIAVNSFSVVTPHNDQYLRDAYKLTSATIYTSYSEDYYNEFMTDTNTKLPLKDAMVPQGLTKVDDNYLISSYDFNKEQSSIIYVCDEEGSIKCENDLGMKSHVGGIAYDQKNNLVWVAASRGYVNAYCKDEVIDEIDCECRYSFNVSEGLKNYMYPWKNSISYLAIDGNHLYVGSFALFKNGLVKKYLIENNNGSINLSLVSKFKVPTKVQSLTIYHKDDKDYLLLSRSFGENIPSILQIFTYQEDIDDYTNPKINSVCYKTDAMMEQIIIDNNTLYAIFESSAYPYRYSSSSADNLESTDMSLILLPK